MLEKLNEIAVFLKSKGRTEKTIKTYICILNKLFSKIGTNFKEQEVEDFLIYANLSPRTYNLYRAVINFYTTKYLNFFIKIDKAKIPRSLPTFVTKEEINKIISNTLNKKHKLGLALLYSSGFRIGELCRLKKEDFNFGEYTVMIREGKGKKDRMTFINVRLVKILQNYINSIKDSDYIFPTYNGHISERSFEEVLKRALKKSGITKDITLHDLRHSFAINLVNAGIDIEEVRKMLGHNTLRTTQIYLQCKTSNLKEIALRLDGNITQLRN